MPVKSRFFKETGKKLDNALVTFQTSFAMVPFIAYSLEKLIYSFAERFMMH